MGLMGLMGRMGGRGKDGRGFFCGCNDIFCSPLRYRNSHWQFLQIRDSFFMGLMGLDGGNKMAKV